MNEDLIRQVDKLQQEVDGLAKPEIGGLSFIEEQILTGIASDISFSSIPQNYRHLLIFTQARTDKNTGEAQDILVQFNGDTGNNYEDQQLYATDVTVAADAGGPATDRIRLGAAAVINTRANNFPVSEMMVYAYSRTDREKHTRQTTQYWGNASAKTDFFLIERAGRWRDTDGITSIRIYPSTADDFIADSIFTLYGLL